jgi:hypothetical protein
MVPTISGDVSGRGSCRCKVSSFPPAGDGAGGGEFQTMKGVQQWQ